MTLTIWGPGAVGLVIGARLARAGESVLFVCRDTRSVEQIESDGVHFEDLASGEEFRVHASARPWERVGADEIGTGPVLLCVRRAQTADAAERLRKVAADRLIVCVQNGIDAQRALGTPNAIGAVYRQTCTRRGRGSAVSAGAGRIVLESASRPDVAALGRRLHAAGYDVGLSEHIERDQWLKLCVNLMSAPNALIRREDHTSAAFVEIKTALLTEARCVIRAAGIRAESCDGRDRSLDAEIEFQHAALDRGDSARSLPLYNQVWSALRDGGPVEADTYHETLIELARSHGVETPINDAVLQALKFAVREGRGPESFSALEILDR